MHAQKLVKGYRLKNIFILQHAIKIDQYSTGEK